MKTFKDTKALEKRLQKGMCWGDTIKVHGRTYKMIEYGTGYRSDYMIFKARNGHTIHIDYDVPSFNHVDGQRVQTKEYAFYSLSEWDDNI